MISKCWQCWENIEYCCNTTKVIHHYTTTPNDQHKQPLHVRKNKQERRTRISVSKKLSNTAYFHIITNPSHTLLSLWENQATVAIAYKVHKAWNLKKEEEIRTPTNCISWRIAQGRASQMKRALHTIARLIAEKNISHSWHIIVAISRHDCCWILTDQRRTIVRKTNIRNLTPLRSHHRCTERFDVT